MKTIHSVSLLVAVGAVAVVGGCELALRAAPCPCAEGWTCCPAGNICVLEASECVADADGGTGDAAGHSDAGIPQGNPQTGVATLATGTPGAYDIAVDETHVYWVASGMAAPTDTDAQILRVAKWGGTPEVVLTLPPRVYHFTLDSTHVYVAHHNSPQGGAVEGAGAILRVPKAGGAAETVAAGLTAPYAIAVDEQDVYWSKGFAYTGAISRTPKAGGAVVTLGDGVDNPWDLALDDTFVYYTEMNKGRVMRLAKAGGAPAELASGWVGTGTVAVDDTSVFFTACPTGPCEEQRLYAVPKTGGPTRLLASRSSAGGDGAVQVGPTWVYWSGIRAGASEASLGVIDMVARVGGDLLPLVAGLDAPIAIAAEPDGSSVYWVDVISGDVGRVWLP
ncbi:MAG TPA: hypothetical protein VGQ83_07870 [Polyangia bacterium]|jgi:hypothetical protein